MSPESKPFAETIDVNSSNHTLTNNSDAVNTEETKVTLSLLVHSRFINKPTKESAGHNLTEWNVTSSHVKSIARQLKQGRAIIPAYTDAESFATLKRDYQKDQDGKDWTVSNDQIVGSDLIAIDYDHVSVDALPDKRFCEWSFYAYATPSAVQTDQGWNRHRWLIKLPEMIDLDRLRAFRLAFMDRYAIESDQSVASPHQMIYGCNDPAKFIKEDFSCVLPYDIFAECLLASADFDTESERNTKTGRIRKREKDSPLTKCDHYLIEKLGSLSAILEKLFPEVSFKRKRSRDVHEQYDCVSFLNDESRNSTGFTIFHSALDDEGIYANHRQWGYSISLYELWTRYKIKRETGVESVDPSDLDVSFEMKGSRFIEMFRDVSAACEVEEFTFEKSKATLGLLDLELLRTILIFADTGDTSYSYHYYSAIDKTWFFSKNKAAALTAVKDYCEENEIEWTAERKEVSRNKKGETVEEIKVTNYIAENYDRLSGKSAYTLKPGQTLDEHTDYVGFKNKAFNLKTNEFVEHQPWMHFKEISDIEIPDFIDPAWGNPFKEFNAKWTKSDRDAKLLLFNSIVGYRRCAHHYLLITHIVGRSQIGKTTFAESIARPFVERDDLISDDKAYLADIKCKDGRTGMSRSPDWNKIRKQTRVCLLDEMEDYTLSIEDVKRVANRNSHITIDEKYTPVYNVLRRFPVIGASEVMPKMPNTLAEGGYNRLQWIDLRHWNKDSMESTPYDEKRSFKQAFYDLYIDRESCNRFMLWSLACVTKEELDQMYAEICAEKSELAGEIMEENAGINSFDILLSDHFELTLNEEDYAFTQDVIETFDAIENEQECRGYTNKRKATTGKTFNKRFEEYLQRYKENQFTDYIELKRKQVVKSGQAKQVNHPNKKTKCPVVWGLKTIKPLNNI